MAKITKIEIQKRNKERVNIYIDDEYAFSTFIDIVYKEGLSKGQEVNKEKYDDIIKKENKQKCKNTALRIIERAYKTEKEMRKRLSEKGYEKEEIDEAVNFLKEYKFIDDDSYVKLYIKEKIKSYGSQKIKYSLINKGISKEVIEEELNNIESEEMKQTALCLAEKKYKNLSKSENDKFKLYNKICRYLISRGYEYDMVKSVTNKVLERDIW